MPQLGDMQEEPSQVTCLEQELCYNMDKARKKKCHLSGLYKSNLQEHELC